MKKQKRKFNVGIKLWIATSAWAGVFGEGRYRLLRLISKHGSLKKAAEQNRISYRKAWGDIKKTESRMGRKLLIRECGGKGGGGSRLTPFTQELLKTYKLLKEEVTVYAEKQYTKRMGTFLKS